MDTVLYPVNRLNVGGAEQQLLELVRGLDKRRFHPIVVPLYAGGALDEEFENTAGVEVIQLRRKGKYDPSPLWELAALIKQRNVSLVQPFLTPATFFGLVPALVARRPATVVTERCGVRLIRGAGYKTYRTIEDSLTRYADVIVANSAAGKDMLIERGIAVEKIRVIYNGVNLDRLMASPEHVAAIREWLNVPEGGATVGILASLTPAKDHASLLRAIAELRGKHPGIRAAVIGDGVLRGELEALARDLGIEEQTVFLGNQREVGSFLAACDLLVSSSCDNEGCSNSIIEAMTVGPPVIGTDVGGTRELIDDGVTGYLVPARDPRALAASIDAVITNRPAAAAIAARGKASAEARFSLRLMVQQYEELYDQLLQRRCASAPEETASLMSA